MTTGILLINGAPPQATDPTDNSPLTAAQTGWIEVVVRDSETSDLLQSAFATLTQYGSTIDYGYTDSNGFINFTGLDIGWFNVTVSKAGYKTQTKTTYINWDGDDDYFYFYLEPWGPGTGYMEINVDDNASSDISYPYIQVYNTSTGALIMQGQGDANGFFNATGLYIGWHTIVASANGYIPQSKDNYINWNGDDDYVFFELIPYGPNTGYIEVSVKDNGGLPISSAYVRVEDSSENYVTSGYTDSNGFYNATGLAIGWYYVTASKASYIPQKKANYINWNGDDDYLYFNLNPYPDNTGYIEVFVYDDSVTPLQNAYVYVIDDETGATYMTGYTDSSGFFNVTGLAKETWYRVHVGKYGFVPQLKNDYINWNGDDDYLYYYLNAPDPNAHVLDIKVRHYITHTTIGNAIVTVKQLGSTIAHGTTGNWGEFTAYVADNSTPLSIDVYAPSYISNTSIPLDLSSLPDPADFIVYMAPSTTTAYIETTVRDAADNTLIDGVSLYLEYPDGSSALVGTTTGGFFNITGLDLGWHYVTAVRTGYYNATKANLINWIGDDDYITIYMTRISFVSQTLTLQPITPNPDPTGDIDLLWNDVLWETGYKVYRSLSSGSLELIATLGAGVTSYKDVGLTEGNANESGFVFYQIVAINGSQTIASNIESVEVYSFGGAGIPGFEGLVLVLAVSLLVVIYRWKKAKNKPFLNLYKI
jgi:hypothetical protein